MTTPDPSIDERRHSPSTERNRDPILAVLSRVLPPQCAVLEIASGTGQHAAWFASKLPSIRLWQPTDADPESLPSIKAWAEALPTVRPPIHLDVTANWPSETYDIVVCINMIHIAPWTACQALMRGAAAVLKAGGLLFMYGPYRVDGKHTAPSNESFDQSLKSRDPSWGVRDVNDVKIAAESNGILLSEIVQMPGNNLSLVFRRS